MDRIYLVRWFRVANWGKILEVRDQTPMGAIGQHQFANLETLEWEVIEITPHADDPGAIYNGTLEDVTEQYNRGL